MSFILLVEQTAPETPSANQVVLYPKSDGLMYSKDDAGTESVIASGAATQAQQEAGVSTNVFTSPGRQHFNPSAAKFWVRFNSAGSISASYNVLSITDGGVGVWTVNVDTDFSGGAYAALAWGGHVGGVIGLAYFASAVLGTGTVPINAGKLSDGTLTDPDTPDAIFTVGYGDQA